MARPKGAKNKKTETKDPMIEEIIEQEIEFVCPKRGKVKQIVKIKKLRALKPDERRVVSASDDVDKLDADDDTIYGRTEDEEVGD